MKWLLILAVLAVAPIWRVAGSKEGYPVWEAGVKHLKEVKHIPIEEASRRARVAYHAAHPAVT